MKRTGLLVLGVIAPLLLVPAVAAAKVPPFTVEASPSDPAAGEVVRLTVRFWDDREHTKRATWWDFRAFEEFLWAHPVGYATEAIPIDIRLVRPGVYRAQLTVSSPGRWILCPWQPRCAGEPSMAGYPNRIALAVASSAPDPVPGAAGGSRAASPVRLWAPLLALSALGVAAAALVMRSVRVRRT